MGVLGTFGSYSSAILGIHVAQTAMQVTGNNIGNINTTGYTRQRVDQCSIYSSGTPRYQNSYNQNIGYGAIVDNVSQLRDPYLDIRYRNENSKLGYYESMQEGLNQISHILDEVGKGENNEDFGVIEAKLGDFKNALRDLLQYPDSTQHDDLVNAAASTLCRLFNSAAKELQEVKVNEEDRMMEDVNEINDILDNIRDLNEEIRTHSIYEDNALELRDARNVQIDKLSKYMQLDVVYSMEKLDNGREIEKLTISLNDTTDPYTGKPYVLVDGIYATQFLMPEGTPKLNTQYNEDLDTSKIYWNTQTKKPTNDVREARRWNIEDEATKYDRFALRFVDQNGNETESASHLEGDPPVRVPNADNPKYFAYIASDEIAAEFAADPDAAKENHPDVIAINGKYYTNNQNKAGLLYNDASNAEASAYNAASTTGPTLFDPTLPSSYKYLADETTDPAVLNQKNGDNPDYMVMEKDGVYYTNIWNNEPDDDNPSYAMALDNFKEGSDENLYLFTLDALKDKRGFVQYEGTDLESMPADLGDNDLYGSLQALRELLTEEGEFASAEDLLRDPDAATKRGIPYYQHMLDSYAQKFAKTFNDNNQIEAGKLNDVYELETPGGDTFKAKDGGTVNYTDSTGQTQAVNYSDMKDLYEKISNPRGETATGDPFYKDFPQDEDAYAAYQQDIKTYQSCMEALRNNGVLNSEYDYYDGGVLFSNSGNTDDPTGITAANISVSHSWSEGYVRVLNSTEPKSESWHLDENGNVVMDTVESKTNNDNIAHMMSLMDQTLEYVTTDTVHDAVPTGKPFFTGSFQEMYRESCAMLGRDSQQVNLLEGVYSLNALTLDNDRMSVSAVDLNEEATDMMKYSQAFSAACQLLTTIDSMLDRLINNTI